MIEIANQSYPHRSALAQAIATLNPSYFALVMATGIVSIACQLLGFRWLALPHCPSPSDALVPIRRP